MDLEQDYQYYQLQNNNKQLIQELINNNNNIKRDNGIDDITFIASTKTLESKRYSRFIREILDKSQTMTLVLTVYLQTLY